jgi:hypothetical protein
MGIRMKKLVLGAAAVAALLAPAIANAQTNAVVGIDYNHLDFDSAGDGNLYGLNGAFNHDFANGTQIQLDGAADRVDVGFCCQSANYAAVHYGVRNDQYSYAGFVGTQSLSLFSGIDVGVEGQMHFGNASVGASLSYADFGDIDVSAWNANIDGLYFFTPNFSVNAGAGYTNVDLGGSDDYWTWNVGGEYRFDNSPFSVSLGYRQQDLDGGDISAWTVGLTLDLGTGTLQERRVHGPSWGGARSLYDDAGATGVVII